jgi:hypothetical protein
VRLPGLATIEKSRAKQISRVTWLKLGDANAKFFHLMENNRKKKNYMHTKQVNNDLAVTQAQKQQAVYEHYLKYTRTYAPRQCSLNFSSLKWEPKYLNHLKTTFTEQEIKNVIFSAPKEKAPRPDGFIGLFFSSCWELIKHDLIRAIHHFYTMNQQVSIGLTRLMWC